MLSRGCCCFLSLCVVFLLSGLDFSFLIISLSCSCSCSSSPESPPPKFDMFFFFPSSFLLLLPVFYSSSSHLLFFLLPSLVLLIAIVFSSSCASRCKARRPCTRARWTPSARFCAARGRGLCTRALCRILLASLGVKSTSPPTSSSGGDNQ